MEDFSVEHVDDILDNLGITLTHVNGQDTAAIVSLVLMYMIEEAERHLQDVEIPISDMIWEEVSAN